MRVNKSLSDPYAHSGRNEEERSAGTSDFFFQAIENADGVPFQLIFGPQMGEGIYLNTGAGISQLLGIPPEDFSESIFQGMIEEIIPLSDDIPADRVKSRRKFINGGIKTYMAELLIRTPGGARKWILDTSVPLLDEETGRVIGSRGILYDDNHRQRILDNILETRHHADEAERLQAAFLHNISHEIRTPLNAIVGFSTLLEECCDSPERRREYLEIILRSSDHLLEIIDDIMEISKIEAGTITLSCEKVDLNLVLQKVYDQFSRTAAEKGIILNYFAEADAGDPEIYTDSYKITQVLRNLVSNGLKFTCEGRVDFGYVRKEKDIEFFVKDTGIGIPFEQQADIFNMFYQADSASTRRYEGAGLGLTIAKAYVELLGGVIWFTSEPGKGSEFRFMVETEEGEAAK